MKTSQVIAAAAFGLMTQLPGMVQAQTNVVFASLTVAVQGPTTTKGALTMQTIKYFSVSTKDLLKLIADNLNTNFPAGAQLVLEDETTFAVYTAHPRALGTKILDVPSDLLSADDNYDLNGGSGDDLYQGTDNNATGAYAGYQLELIRVRFNDANYNDNGTSFTFVAKATEPDNYNPVTHVYKQSMMVTAGIGSGHYQGNYIVIQGVVNTSTP